MTTQAQTYYATFWWALKRYRFAAGFCIGWSAALVVNTLWVISWTGTATPKLEILGGLMTALTPAAFVSAYKALADLA